jgi:predicted PurR-regulated permease PerM
MIATIASKLAHGRSNRHAEANRNVEANRGSAAMNDAQPPPRSAGLGDTEAVRHLIFDSVIRLAILLLITYWSLTLVAPFISLVIWAVVLTVALYPLFELLARLLGGRKILAAVIITLVMLAIVAGPVGLVIAGLTTWLAGAVEAANSGSVVLPPLPEAVRDLPVLGEKLSDFWALASTNLEIALTSVGPELADAGRWILAAMAGLGGSVLAFAASSIIAGIMLVHGPRLANAARSVAHRLVAKSGESFVEMAGATIRNVSRGVIGISLLQAILIGVGLIAAGLPAAGALTIAALVLGILQIGVVLVVLPVLIWSWSTQDAVTAGLLTIYLLPVGLVDNILKPIVMSKGLRVPMLVILLGVIGGTLSYGLIGLFLGPIVLSVFYELLVAWVAETETTE